MGKALDLASEEAQKALQQSSQNDLNFRLKAADALALVGIGEAIDNLAKAVAMLDQTLRGGQS